MTKAEIIDDLKTRDTHWLESRWSVLGKAVEAIELHLAEVEAVFDYDYTVDSKENTLESHVDDQVLDLFSLVSSSDTDETLSWTEICDLINTEIERREEVQKKEHSPIIEQRI